jgi:tetratricopeptide (TPR) repeat protein
MRYLLFLFAFVSLQAKAQIPLNFNKGLFESANKWVAIKTAKDSVYGYGFVYMDVSAGLSAHEGGVFKVTKDNIFVATKNLPYQVRIIRLNDNTLRVAWIPANKLKDMQEQETPDWLKSYKADTTSVAYLFRWGFSYNAGNVTDKALYYLDRVKKIDPNYPGLEAEYIYAYNASKQYDKAIALIENALKTQPNNGNLYKELVFAQANSNQLNKAEETYKQGIAHCGNDTKAEMSFNIAYTYYLQKNKDKFNYWADESKQWMAQTDPRINGITQLKAVLNK